MNDIMIVVCAGRMLEKSQTVSSVDIHLYLKGFAPLGNSIVAIDKIEQILDLMVDGGFMEVHSAAEGEPTVYKRFVPERKRKEREVGG